MDQCRQLRIEKRRVDGIINKMLTEKPLVCLAGDLRLPFNRIEEVLAPSMSRD